MAESTTTETKKKLHFVVVVLGDVGRSPRMQYHALSLLQLGDHVTVSLVGYTGEDLIEDLQQQQAQATASTTSVSNTTNKSSRLNVVRFHVPALDGLRSIHKLLYFACRLLTLALWLLQALMMGVPSDPEISCILLQNPPALPLLFISLLFSRIKGLTQRNRPRVVIDWHNLGFSMLDSSNSLPRKLAKAYEFKLAPFVDGHLTVTSAMKYYLLQSTEIRVATNSNDTSMRVLYDCPPSMFKVLNTKAQHAILSKLHSDLVSATPRSWQLQELDSTHETMLTMKSGDSNYEIRHGRPALVTSSTSWTPDEDFGLLLDAVVTLNDRIVQQESTLKVMVVVTGKGPQKAMYEEKMSQLKLTAVAIKTAWLEPGDYPKLLGCADVAVSLHTSTSGLDLPMKILDSYGCHVPVCARDFDCLPELVQDKHNGRIFQTESELADQLWELLEPLTKQPDAAPHKFGNLSQYSDNLQGRRRWQDNWMENALPVLLLEKP